ncbi:bifunctional peptidase and (3S)-lysyl hydroxylase Jmjd7 isoform X2 [Aplysia californica]|uniref:Bifunctional peptidase and (3S)-lysyl hydroxylase Jmjd7 isoform X2 n=1 Tax=Aplysia californica TaxID=6500 RepID=A0ABM1VYE8_APLCA|nr:bifunctional peptidase and (3S)-lysyl hydroxylase Jmjd7 isoform X2 [Aplysia californica]
MEVRATCDLVGWIDSVDAPPDPLTFNRNWVAQNRPLIINNAFDHWPALNKWTDKYLRDKIGEVPVTVAVTPNGYADAINGNRFVMPEERKMSLSGFLDILSSPDKDRTNGVFYIQKQNSNLEDEFSSIMEDVHPFSWAEEVFGKGPDATNFWMGDERAVTSMHKDPYENLYCVVSGHKDFLLLPPTDLPYLPYEKYPAASYKENEDGKFEIIDEVDSPEVPWINIDPLNPDLEKYPNYAKAQPMTCRVKAGQMLYLPSLWFHHVRQSHGCIAVNFWYDMVFDFKWAYFRFLEQLVSKDSP